jgi:hypothetical protein
VDVSARVALGALPPGAYTLRSASCPLRRRQGAKRAACGPVVDVEVHRVAGRNRPRPYTSGSGHPGHLFRAARCFRAVTRPQRGREDRGDAGLVQPRLRRNLACAIFMMSARSGIPDLRPMLCH